MARNYDVLPPSPARVLRSYVRELLLLGRSAATIDCYSRRFAYARENGLDVEAFWGDEEAAWRLGSDYLAERRLVLRDKPDAWRNDVRLLNSLAKAARLARMHRHVVEWDYPKRTPEKRRALRPQHVQRAFTYRHRDPMYQVRDLAILQTALLTADRRTELHRLDEADLDPEISRIHVEATKNGVVTDVPVEREAWNPELPLMQWLSMKPRAPDGALFTTLQGPIRRLGAAGVYHVLFRIGRQVGVPLNALVTRHTRARRLKLAGWPEDEIGVMLRHTSRQATRIYTEVGVDDAAHRMETMGGPGLFGDPRQNRPCPGCGRPMEVSS